MFLVTKPFCFLGIIKYLICNFYLPDKISSGVNETRLNPLIKPVKSVIWTRLIINKKTSPGNRNLICFLHGEKIYKSLRPTADWRIDSKVKFVRHYQDDFVTSSFDFTHKNDKQINLVTVFTKALQKEKLWLKRNKILI